MTRMKRVGSIAGMMAALAVTVACSDRAERKADAAAADAGRAAEKAGDAMAETAKDAGNAVASATENAAEATKDGARAAGEAIKDGAQATTDAVKNGGRAADAAVETMDVKMALAADARVDASDINVDTDHTTKTVTLRGRVPTEAQKTTAGQIATAKAVGYRVNNVLMVGR